MKKNLRKVFLALLAVLLVSLFASCASKDSIYGTWEWKLNENNYMIMKFSKKTMYTKTVTAGIVGEKEYSATYSNEGNVWTVKNEKETLQFTVNGDTLDCPPASLLPDFTRVKK